MNTVIKNGASPKKTKKSLSEQNRQIQIVLIWPWLFLFIRCSNRSYTSNLEELQSTRRHYHMTGTFWHDMATFWLISLWCHFCDIFINSLSRIVFLSSLVTIWKSKFAKIAPSIKFTMQHTEKCSDTNDSICDFETWDIIPFLDTKLSIRDGKIKSDLYRKPIDREQYLLPSSCHPPHCTDNMQLKLKLSLAKS